MNFQRSHLPDSGQESKLLDTLAQVEGSHNGLLSVKRDYKGINWLLRHVEYILQD